MSERRVVVGLGPVPPGSVEPLLGEDVDFRAEPGAEDLAVAEGAIVRAAVTVGEEELAAMPRMRVLARTGVGTDRVDLDAAARRGIPVAVTPGANTHAVAEGAFAAAAQAVRAVLDGGEPAATAG